MNDRQKSAYSGGGEGPSLEGRGSRRRERQRENDRVERGERVGGLKAGQLEMDRVSRRLVDAQVTWGLEPIPSLCNRKSLAVHVKSLDPVRECARCANRSHSLCRCASKYNHYSQSHSHHSTIQPNKWHDSRFRCAGLSSLASRGSDQLIRRPRDVGRTGSWDSRSFRTALDS